MRLTPQKLLSTTISDCYIDSEDFIFSEDVFFTKVLPQVGKDFLTGLITGKYVNNSILKQDRYSRPLPLLFNDILYCFFTKRGILRDDFPILDIRITLQLFMTYYKFSSGFSKATLAIAKEKFIKDDLAVMKCGFYHINQKPSFLSVRKNFRSCFPDNPWDIRPRHSNGSTNTTGYDNLSKRLITRHFDSIMATPLCVYLNVNTHTKDDSHEKSRITFVEKDSRGPRTISMEPHERMYLQLGVHDKIVEFQEHLLDYTKGRINYTDQTINQKLAYSSSIDGYYATIDMKDASDMVSWFLIKELLSSEWFDIMRVLRTTHVLIDDVEIELNKFASMGSAICFPIMATLIYSIATTIHSDCYVYGDDLICPAFCAEEIMAALISYGFRINHDKSFITGPFRESCGGDFYRSHNVSYIKCTSHELVNIVEFANLMSCYSQDLSESLFKIIEEYYGPVYRDPVGSEPAPCVFRSRYSSSNSCFFKHRYNDDIQSWEVQRLGPITSDIDVKLTKQLKKQNKFALRKNRNPYGPYVHYQHKPSYYYTEWLSRSCPSVAPLEYYSTERVARSVEQKSFNDYTHHKSVRHDLFDTDTFGSPNESGAVTFRKSKREFAFSWFVDHAYNTHQSIDWIKKMAT